MKIRQEIFEAIAFRLKPSSNGDVAFLIANDTIYFATQTEGQIRLPKTPIVNLIQGIHELFAQQAFRILRNRIYSTSTHPTVMCWGMTKVAAKRLTTGIQAKEHTCSLNFRMIDVTNWEVQSQTVSLHSKLNPLEFWQKQKPPETNQEFMELAYRIARSVQRSGVQYRDSRAIASLLVSTDPQTGKPNLISFGMNSSSENRTLHAEVILIQSYFRRYGQTLPANSKIFTTLKSCRMCASMIWHCASHLETLTVYYGENDPGPHAKDTILSPHTPDRRRFCTEKAEQALIIEYPL